MQTSSDRLTLAIERLSTPIGTIVLLIDEQNVLRMLHWENGHEGLQKILRRRYGVDRVRLVEGGGVSAVRASLEAYFAGELEAIDRIPVKTEGTTFQRQVWSALRAIPAGQTCSYSELAGRLSRPKAVRAVGLANGSNPIGIVVPCHRVIGSNGSLTGYGGGLDRKRWLLEHEGI